MTVMKETMGKNNGIQQPRGAGRKLSSNYPVKVTPWSNDGALFYTTLIFKSHHTNYHQEKEC